MLASRHHVKDSKATQARPLQEKQVLAINYQVKETEAKLVQEKQVLARNHHVKETEAKEANLIEERQVLASKHHVKETDRGNASQSLLKEKQVLASNSLVRQKHHVKETDRGNASQSLFKEKQVLASNYHVNETEAKLVQENQSVGKATVMYKRPSIEKRQSVGDRGLKIGQVWEASLLGHKEESLKRWKGEGRIEATQG